MSLPNPNTVVTEERLSEFYVSILPYLGGMPEMLANKFSKGDLYFTDEKMIGRWIDGKPIYQKTIDFGVLPNNSAKVVNPNIDNLDKIINCTGIAYLNTNQLAMVLPNSAQTQINEIALDYIYGQGVRVMTAGDQREWNICYVTLQYTKTTDSVIEIGDDTDYSTTEKIVGTWIDGKPLYQKVVDCGAMPNSTTKTISHSISNIDNIVNYHGIAIKSSDSIPLPYPGNPTSDTIKIHVNKMNILIIDSADWSNYPASYVTVQYTKTTD